MLPVIPHFANECLRINKYKKKYKWPNYDEKIFKRRKNKFCSSN